MQSVQISYFFQTPILLTLGPSIIMMIIIIKVKKCCHKNNLFAKPNISAAFNKQPTCFISYPTFSLTGMSRLFPGQSSINAVSIPNLCIPLYF